MTRCEFCTDPAETYRKDAITGEIVNICWDCDCARREWADFSADQRRKKAMYKAIKAAQKAFPDV